MIDLAGICDNNAESAREKSELFGVPVMTMEEIKADPEIRLAVNRAHALNSEIFRFIRNPGGGFVSESKEHAARMLRAGEFGRSWKTADDNLYAGSLLFENGAVGTLHFDGESIDEEQSSLVIYGTEGILKLGDPNTFNGSVRLIRNNTQETEMPFTHGFTGSPLYGPETIADYGQHRGVGAAEMAWAMIGHRPHRASAGLALICPLHSLNTTPAWSLLFASR